VNVVLGSRKVFCCSTVNLLSIDRGLLADCPGLGGKKNQSMLDALPRVHNKYFVFLVLNLVRLSGLNPNNPMLGKPESYELEALRLSRLQNNL
jgi:hypothetical protein